MSKHTPGGLTRRNGTVSVIETPVQHTHSRNAKIAFWIVLVPVALGAAVILAEHFHPLAALIMGLLIGAGSAIPIWALIRIWPIIRYLWWWLPEILLIVALVTGWVQLANHTDLITRAVIVAALVGIPAAIGYTRRRIVALAWCLIVRHRLRNCFDDFIITNRHGSLPLILWARPTQVGERVWVWLRPGLSVPDLHERLDKIAVACWASSVTVEKASTSNSAYVRIDIKRRDALSTRIESPLADLIPSTHEQATATTLQTAPAKLDLPDITADSLDGESAHEPRKKPGRKTTAVEPAEETVKNSATRDDISEWI